MDEEAFLKRLLSATDRALTIAREAVTNYLPDKITYGVLRNQSYDGNPIGPAEQVFHQDRGLAETVEVNSVDVLKLLWRDGSVPEWINVNVEAADEERTFINLRSCGRFTALDDLLYHQQEGYPPFHVLGPSMPLELWRSKSRQKFDLAWRQTKLRQELGEHFPDVLKHGSLAQLLNARLKQSGSQLNVRGLEEVRMSSFWARAEADGRSVQISCASHERLFSAAFWDRGVSLATFNTGDVDRIVRSIELWCGIRVRTTDLKGLSEAVKLDAVQVASFEAGPAAFTSFRWAQLLKAADETPQNRRLLPIIQAAVDRPELSQLFPYTSMMRLGFSRCTGYPYSGDCPLIVPIYRTDTFQVVDGRGKPVGNGNTLEAIDLAVSHLPANCGAAVHGTADDLEAGPLL